MSDKDGCKGCGETRRKAMTRAEFLAGGAVAAAAASIGGLGFTTASAHDLDIRSPRQQSCRGQCPPAQERWAIPSGILNAFWNECFPRLVAKWWLDPTSVHSLNSPSMSSDPSSTATLDFLKLLVSDLDGLATDPGSRFEARRDAVTAYLEGPPASPINNRMPIRFVPAGGFDFVLSDWGMELFSPPNPGALVDVLLFYTYRRTGNAAIGIPFYMQDAVLARDISAPTGPSQTWIDPAVIRSIVRVAREEGMISQQCASTVFMCLDEGVTIPDTPAAAMQMPTMSDPSGSRSRGRRPAQSEESTRRRLESAVRLETVECVLEPARCWQVTGAVYRGIQVELPRIVATSWLERGLNAETDPDCYTQRLSTTNGFREIMMERMESSLPGLNAMRFELQSGTIPPHWKAGDIMITNEGFFFPDIPVLPVPSTQALADILTAIANGEAGNPVFTDSTRSE